MQQLRWVVVGAAVLALAALMHDSMRDSMRDVEMYSPISSKKPQMFVISLRQDRFRAFKNRLPRNASCTLLPATDGRRIDVDEWRRRNLFEDDPAARRAFMADPDLYESNRRELTRGELGCYDSHRRAWQHMLDDNIDVAIVCEDDAIVGEREYAHMLAVLQKNNWDLVYFGTNWNPPLTRIDDDLSEPHIYGQFHVLHAYALTKRAARTLLERATPMMFPVDVYVASHAKKIRLAQTTRINVRTLDAPSDTQGIR